MHLVLSTSLVTKWDGHEVLDQDTIEGIRCERYIINGILYSR